MSIRKIALFLLGVQVLSPAYADELRDLSQRIEFGYFAEESSVVEAAVRDLAPRSERNDDAALLLALARYRIGGVETRPGPAARALSACVDAAAGLAEEAHVEAESHLLVAACSLQLASIEPMRALLHDRRADRALEAVRRIDAENPRLALLDALRYGRREDTGAGYLARLQTAKALFSQRPGHAALEWLNWGAPETHLALARAHLAGGDVRAARDAVESALWLAPGYVEAVVIRDGLR